MNVENLLRPSLLNRSDVPRALFLSVVQGREGRELRPVWNIVLEIPSPFPPSERLATVGCRDFYILNQNPVLIEESNPKTKLLNRYVFLIVFTDFLHSEFCLQKWQKKQLIEYCITFVSLNRSICYLRKRLRKIALIKRYNNFILWVLRFFQKPNFWNTFFIGAFQLDSIFFRFEISIKFCIFIPLLIYLQNGKFLSTYYALLLYFQKAYLKHKKVLKKYWKCL